MEWKETLNKSSKILEDVVEYLEVYVDAVNWAYVGVGLFSVMFVWFLIDSLSGSQTSPVFLFGVLIGLFILAFLAKMAASNL